MAIRRTTRVGEHASVPVEDLGIGPDRIHRLTRNDVLNGNVDLINEAARMLVELQPVCSLTAELAATVGDELRVKATSKKLTRIDVFVNGRPSLTLDVADGSATFSLPKPASATAVIELRGYNGDQLAAATRLTVER